MEEKKKLQTQSLIPESRRQSKVLKIICSPKKLIPVKLIIIYLHTVPSVKEIMSSFESKFPITRPHETGRYTIHKLSLNAFGEFEIVTGQLPIGSSLGFIVGGNSNWKLSCSNFKSTSDLNFPWGNLKFPAIWSSTVTYMPSFILLTRVAAIAGCGNNGFRQQQATAIAGCNAAITG